MRRLLLALLPCLLLPGDLSGQRASAPAASRYRLAEPAPVAGPGGWAEPESWQQSPAVRVAASALLPGAGQYLQGQRRWVPYLALEIWAWLRYREHRSDASRLAARYRDVAWGVARRVSVGARRDTVFEYYEAMDQYSASGAWDAAPLEEGLQPERQPGTFNGDVWDLAGRLYLRGGDYGPGTLPYEDALAYYRDHAIPDAYAWAWGSNLLEKKVFKDLISQSDEAYREGTRVLSLIFANHFASAVDALISSRLGSASGQARLETGFLPQGDRTRIETRLRIHF